MSQDFSDCSLREYFERAYRPTFLAECRPSTLAIYESLLARWEELALYDSTLLCEIDNGLLADFRSKLKARETSPHTVNKYLRALNAMLAKAGPAGRGNRDGLGVLTVSPWVKLLKTPTARPRAIPLDVLGLIYRACDTARVPNADGIDPAEWWRGLVVMASQTGIRRSALLGLTWRNCNDEAGKLIVPANLDKMGVERLKPINRVTLEHLLEMWQRCLNHECRKQAGSENGNRYLRQALDEKIFAWPYRSMRMFYIEWHALQQAAGVPLEELYHFHDLKKTCGTQLATVAGAHAVREMLDHTTVEMGQRYVAGGEALREALEKMPRPAEFDRGAR